MIPSNSQTRCAAWSASDEAPALLADLELWVVIIRRDFGVMLRFGSILN